MNREPLPRIMRVRVVVVAVCTGLLALLVLPLEILALQRGGSIGQIAPIFGIGLGIPVLFGLVMWWQVRRYRSNPEIRRRQPNGAAMRVLMVGNWLSVALAMLARGVSGVQGWGGWAIGLGVLLTASVIVYSVAKRYDPRLHYFRRTDPLPEGKEPDDLPPPKPVR